MKKNASRTNNVIRSQRNAHFYRTIEILDQDKNLFFKYIELYKHYKNFFCRPFEAYLVTLDFKDDPIQLKNELADMPAQSGYFYKDSNESILLKKIIDDKSVSKETLLSRSICNAHFYHTKEILDSHKDWSIVYQKLYNYNKQIYFKPHEATLISLSHQSYPYILKKALINQSIKGQKTQLSNSSPDSDRLSNEVLFSMSLLQQSQVHEHYKNCAFNEYNMSEHGINLSGGASDSDFSDSDSGD